MVIDYKFEWGRLQMQFMQVAVMWICLLLCLCFAFYYTYSVVHISIYSELICFYLLFR